MKKNYSKLITIFISALLLNTAIAQVKTGSFNRTVPVSGEPNRTLSYYVPPSYDSTHKYKLIIGLHGLGDTSENYRNFFVESDGILTDTNSTAYNAIFVAPESGDNIITDFWTPVSDTCIITKVINDAMSVYNIDKDYIYLQEFSQ